MLADILKEKKCFKLVLGAGNEDVNLVVKLVALYSKAGCNFFDIAANSDVLKAAKEGLKIAGINNDRYLCVSVGTKGDPHINKACIDDNCTECGQCQKICPENAIKNYKIISKKCIGCTKCISFCPKNAITMQPHVRKIDEILPPLINLGIDCIEFHAVSDDENKVMSDWQIINSLYDGVLSICLDRFRLSDKALINRLKQMLKIRKPYSTIIQADGVSMSGGENTYRATLQTVATAELIQNAGFEAYLLLSGGTNSKTAKLAKMCNVDYNGISVGSYARKIVREYVERDDFLSNEKVFNKAMAIAKELVSACLI